MQRTKLLIFIALLFILSQTTQAQNNLILNPGFETETGWLNYAIDPADENTRFDVPASWNGWLALTPRTADWMNVYPNVRPQIGWPRRSGERAINMSRGQATFTAALYQQVSVAAGTNVQGGAWAYNENPRGTARAGIDPNGGNNPYDTDIIWGNWVSGPNSNFFETTVNATATGSSVTLWLFATQSEPSDPNGVYWDDAYLTVGGPGGSSPSGGTPVSGVPVVPTSAPPAVAGFVVPQAPQADGSIIHTVQTGDTLAAIAFAYGVTIEQIQRLNNISNPRLISVGQRLIIQEATEGSASASESTQAAGNESPESTAEGGDREDAARLATSTPVPATPTPAAPAPVREVAQGGVDPAQTGAALCVIMFEDENQNRIQDEGEALLEDGAIALRGEGVGEEEDTTDTEPLCFDELAAGDYVAAASAPNGYGLTTPDQLQVRLFAGETLTVAFGAAEGVEAVIAPTGDAQLAPQPAEDNIPPLVQETAEDTPVNLLVENSGLIVFGLAGLVMIIGLGVTLVGLFRRR